MIALVVGNARLWKIHIPRGCSTSWDKIWEASKGWAQHWGEKETPEPEENTALTVNHVSHSWGCTGHRYGTAGKAAGSQGNPNQPTPVFSSSNLWSWSPHNTWWWRAGNQSCWWPWKGIPCNGEGTETPREGRRYQGPQPGTAESSCKGTESKIALKQRWGNKGVQQSQRKTEEDRLVEVSKEGNCYDPTSHLAHAQLSIVLAQKSGMEPAEPSAPPPSTGSPLTPLNNLQEERTVPNSLSLQPEAWRNVTKIIGKKSWKRMMSQKKKKSFCSLLLKNFLLLFWVCGIIKIAELGTSWLAWFG